MSQYVTVLSICKVSGGYKCNESVTKIINEHDNGVELMIEREGLLHISYAFLKWWTFSIYLCTHGIL